MMRRWWQRWILDPYGDWNVRRQGRIDGELALPPWQSEQQPEFLRELFRVGQTTLEAIGREWHAADKRMKAAWAAAALREQHATHKLVEARRREQQSQQRYQSVHGRRLAVPETRTHRIWYGLVVALVLVCEFPFNAIVFQQLGIAYYETLLMTGGVAVTLVACAHFLGAQLHEPVKGRPVALANRVLLAVFPFALIVFVSMLRGAHMREQALSSLENWQLVGVNVAINALIFFALTYYSHRIHEPVTLDVLRAVERREGWEQIVHVAEKAAARERIERRKEFDQQRQRTAGIVSEVERRAAVYRRKHIRVRPDRDQYETPAPVWFNQQPELIVPADLAELEWELAPAAEVGDTLGDMVLENN